MDEMIERVTAALRALPLRDLSEPGGELDQLRLREAARAVIEAMREPTEAMSRAGGIEAVEPIEGVWTQEIGDYHAANAWRLMIDAALKPPS